MLLNKVPFPLPTPSIFNLDQINAFAVDNLVSEDGENISAYKPSNISFGFSHCILLKYLPNTLCSSHFRRPRHHASEAEGVPGGVPGVVQEGWASIRLNCEREDEEFRDVGSLVPSLKTL